MKTYSQSEIIVKLNKLREYEGNSPIAQKGFCHGETLLWGVHHILKDPSRIQVRDNVGKMETRLVPRTGFEYDQMLVVLKIFRKRLKKKQPTWSMKKINIMIQSYLFDFYKIYSTRTYKKDIALQSLLPGASLYYTYTQYYLTEPMEKEIRIKIISTLMLELSGKSSEVVNKLKMNVPLSLEEAKSVLYVLIKKKPIESLVQLIRRDIIQSDGLLGENLVKSDIEPDLKVETAILSQGLKKTLIDFSKEEGKRKKCTLSVRVRNELLNLFQSYIWVKDAKAYFSETVAIQTPELIFSDIQQSDEALLFNLLNFPDLECENLLGIKREFIFSSVLSLSEIEFLINKITLNKSNKFFLLSGSDHTVGLYRNSKQMTLFDSNSCVTAYKSNSVNKIGKILLKILNLSYAGTCTSQELTRTLLKVQAIGLNSDPSGTYPSPIDLQKELIEYRQSKIPTSDPKAALEVKSWQGLTPLMAALFGKDLESYQYLVSLGADMSVKAQFTTIKGRKTVLSIPKIAFSQLVNLSLDQLDDVYRSLCITPEEKRNALNFASLYTNSNVIKFFLSKGVNLKALGCDDIPLVFWMARRFNEKEFFQVFDAIPLDLQEELMYEFCYQPNGSKIIHFAAQYKNFKLIEAIATRWPKSLTQLNHEKSSALHFTGSKTILRGNIETVTLLVKLGVPINGLNQQGDSPIMLAAKCGNKETFYTLWELGADTTSHNSKSESLLDVTLKNNRFNIVHCMIQNKILGNRTIFLVLKKCLELNKIDMLCKIVENQAFEQSKYLIFISSELCLNEKWDHLFKVLGFFDRLHTFLYSIPNNIVFSLIKNIKNETQRNIVLSILDLKHVPKKSKMYQYAKKVSPVIFHQSHTTQKPQVEQESIAFQLEKYLKCNPQKVQNMDYKEVEGILMTLDKTKAYPFVFYILMQMNKADLLTYCSRNPQYLAIAILHHHKDLVEKMLMVGVNGNSWTTNDNGDYICAINSIARNDLHLSKKDRNNAIIRLITLGASVNSSDRFGTMAHLFASKGDLEGLQILLNFKADFNSICGGYSNFQCALISKDPKVSRFFIKNKLVKVSGYWLTFFDTSTHRQISYTGSVNIDEFSLACSFNHVDAAIYCLTHWKAMFFDEKTGAANGIFLEGLVRCIEGGHFEVFKVLCEHPFSRQEIQKRSLLSHPVFCKRTGQTQPLIVLAYLLNRKDVVLYSFNHLFESLWEHSSDCLEFISLIIARKDFGMFKEIIGVKPEVLVRPIDIRGHPFNVTQHILKLGDPNFIYLLTVQADQYPSYKMFLFEQVIESFSVISVLPNTFIQYCHLISNDMVSNRKFVENTKLREKLIHDLFSCVHTKHYDAIRLILGLVTINWERIMLTERVPQQFTASESVLTTLLNENDRTLTLLLLKQIPHVFRKAKFVLKPPPHVLIFKMGEDSLKKEMIHVDPDAFFIANPQKYIFYLYFNNSAREVFQLCRMAEKYINIKRQMIFNLFEFIQHTFEQNLAFNTLAAKVLIDFGPRWLQQYENAKEMIALITETIQSSLAHNANAWPPKLVQVAVEAFGNDFVEALKEPKNRLCYDQLIKLQIPLTKENKPMASSARKK